MILAAPNTIVDGTEQTLKTEKPQTEEQKVEQMLKESEEEAFDHLDRRSETAEEGKVEANEQKEEAKVEQPQTEEVKTEPAQAKIEEQPTQKQEKPEEMISEESTAAVEENKAETVKPVETKPEEAKTE